MAGHINNKQSPGMAVASIMKLYGYKIQVQMSHHVTFCAIVLKLALVLTFIMNGNLIIEQVACHIIIAHNGVLRSKYVQK